jgi:ribonuclease D
LVDDDDGLAEVLDAVCAEPVYALDTEFHRERTYFPKLALVQLAWDGGLALIDPLAVDVAPLSRLLDGPGIAVIHAAEQDLEVLDQECGTIPATVFDTQVAAGFDGLSTPSLASLCDRYLGMRLPKGERLTDWLARPLGDAQLSYAASDVLHLLELRDILLERLGERDRIDWALDECDLARTKRRGPRDPDQAWRRIKEVRQLKGRTKNVAKSIAAWRERTAAARDQPVRHVLPDLGVVSIAQRAPGRLAEMKGLRGVDDRFTKGSRGEELLAAVAAGKDAAPADEPDPGPEIDRNLRPAVTLVSAWISQQARELHLDTTLLATRTDIEDLLRGAPGARLTTGWRSEIVGDPIRRLVDGRASLAFDDGSLVLEQRAGH